MMYTVSWLDERDVFFRVSFLDKEMAQSYYDETIALFERYPPACKDFKELKLYEEKI